MPLALKQQTTVIVCPLSPETILLTPRLPLADTTLGSRLGTVLSPDSSMMNMVPAVNLWSCSSV